MIAFGCEDKYRSPIIEDRICPKCGRDIEVFLLGGKKSWRMRSVNAVM